jgi:hypothetical protein
LTDELPDGAWGIRVPAAAEAAGLLLPAPPGWPVVDVRWHVCKPPPDAVEWGPQRAQYTLLGGHHIQIDREPLAAELQLSRATATEGVLTPHLSSAASTVAIWLGREPFHAGAFAVHGGAWGVLGEKGSGKTTTLAVLHLLGVTVLTDDLLVCDDGEVLAGPRCVDLREEPARLLDRGRDIGVVGTRRRWRVDLPMCSASVPLRGWIVPVWGDSESMDLIPPAERLGVLPGFRALRVPWEDPRPLLELAAVPMYRWSRPKRPETMQAVVAGLLDRLDALGVG